MGVPWIWLRNVWIKSPKKWRVGISAAHLSTKFLMSRSAALIFISTIWKIASSIRWLRMSGDRSTAKGVYTTSTTELIKFGIFVPNMPRILINGSISTFNNHTLYLILYVIFLSYYIYCNTDLYAHYFMKTIGVYFISSNVFYVLLYY